MTFLTPARGGEFSCHMIRNVQMCTAFSSVVHHFISTTTSSSCSRCRVARRGEPKAKVSIHGVPLTLTTSGIMAVRFPILV